MGAEAWEVARVCLLEIVWGTSVYAHAELEEMKLFIFFTWFT